MAVLEVTGFQFAKEKIIQTTALMDDLESRDKQIKIIGQLIELCMPSSKMDSWQWTGKYIQLDVNAQDKMLTRRQFVLEIPSFLVYPLAPSVIAGPASGNPNNGSSLFCYPTWKLAAVELTSILDSMWELLEPETEKVIGNAELLPFINNPTALPYQDIDGIHSLLIKNIPDCLVPRTKYGAKEIISCLLCGEDMMLSKMRNHVGSHILHFLRGVEDPKKCEL